MSELRLLWERYLEASNAASEALNAFVVCQKKELETDELARKRLESMRDFGARYFDEHGRVK